MFTFTHPFIIYLFITKCLHLHILLSFIYSLQSVYIYTSFYHLSYHYICVSWHCFKFPQYKINSLVNSISSSKLTLFIFLVGSTKFPWLFLYLILTNCTVLYILLVYYIPYYTMHTVCIYTFNSSTYLISNFTIMYKGSLPSPLYYLLLNCEKSLQFAINYSTSNVYHDFAFVTHKSTWKYSL